MRRKVIRQGTSTLTMSLPAKWIKKHGIKPGDEIDVSEVGDALVLGKGSAKREMVAEVDFEGTNERLIYRNVNNFYTHGYDEIRIRLGNRQQLEHVQHIVGRLLGYAVVEQKENSCVVREVVETRADDFDRIFKQLFFTISELAEDSLSRLRSRDWKNLADVKERDRTIVNKLAFLCLRILSKEGHSNPQKTAPLRDLVIALEDIGDECANLSEEIAQLRKPVSKATTNTLSEVNDLFMAVERIYHNFDPEILKTVHEQCRLIRFEISKAAKSVPREDFIALYHARKIAERLLNAIDSIIVLHAANEQNSTA